jgi:hypothetical protein
LLQRLAILCTAAHSGVQAETVDVGPQRLPEVCLPGHGALHRQHLLTGARTEGDAASTGRSLQRPERAGLVRVCVVVGQVGRTLLFDQHPQTGVDQFGNIDDRLRAGC